MLDDLVGNRLHLAAVGIYNEVGNLPVQGIANLEQLLEKGRARIPMLNFKESMVGDIHKYSADAIDHVTFSPGTKRPLNISVEMNSSVGLFQIEEVLLPKIDSSPLKQHIALYAYVRGEERKQYL